MKYSFEKKGWGAVFLTITPQQGESGLPKTFVLMPLRDIVVSGDGRRIEIDFWENSDRRVSMLPEEISFSESTPVGVDTTDIYEALEQLSRDFFFEVGGSPLPGPTIVGGDFPFTADGTTAEVVITHTLGAVPDFFSLTTTQPITSNHLNRTITFPDDETMVITFGLAPLPGEDAVYIYALFKNP